MRFTPGELKVMQLLWRYGEQKPSELQERYPESIKNPALRSYLKILLEKGHITRRKVGKAYLYKARTKRQKAFTSMLGDISRAFCDGSMRDLLFHLVEQEKLTPAEIKQLQALARKKPGKEKLDE